MPEVFKDSSTRRRQTVCLVQMFLNYLVESPDGLYKSVLQHTNNACVARVMTVNKLFADILKPYMRERKSIRVIERLWSSYGSVKSSANLSRLFIDAGLTEAQMRAVGWTGSLAKIRTPKTMKITKLFLTRAVKVALAISPGPSVLQRFNIRNFLSAFLIACFPANVFSDVGAVEHGVMNAARALLACVESITADLSAGTVFHELPRDRLASLPRLLNEYETAFVAWKTPGMRMMAARMEGAIVQLIAAMEETPEDNAEARAELARQIDRVRAKYLQVVGQTELDAMDMRVGITDVADWANNMMALFMA